MPLPDEILSILEDLGFPTDGIPGKLHAAKVDQQHRRKLALPTTGRLLLFHCVGQ